MRNSDRAGMRRITFTADEDTIHQARARAAREETTLNAAFRNWLERYVGTRITGQDYRNLMKRLRHVQVGRQFSREQLNER